MSNSPNMGLPIPVVGVTSGPTWAANYDSCLNIIDSHTHSAGSGVQITPDGINISKNLTFNSYSATNLLSSTFISQASALTGTNFLSFVGGNLYVNDGSGNQIPITSAGGVAGSPGSIGSLTSPASATYSSTSTAFTWLAGSGKYAAMNNGAITLFQTNTASVNGITLQSPNSLGSAYSLTMPTGLPGSAQYMTSDSSGNLSFSTANQILNATTSNYQISESSNLFSTTSTTLVPVTGLSVTITTHGRPVYLFLIAIYGGSLIVAASTAGACFMLITILNGDSQIMTTTIGTEVGYAGIQQFCPAGSISAFDTPSAGTYTYSVQGCVVAGASLQVEYCKLVAYEL